MKRKDLAITSLFVSLLSFTQVVYAVAAVETPANIDGEITTTEGGGGAGASGGAGGPYIDPPTDVPRITIIGQLPTKDEEPAKNPFDPWFISLNFGSPPTTEVRGNGQKGSGGAANKPDPATGQNASTDGDACGNPVIMSSGNKVEQDTDFKLYMVGGISFTRTYNKNSSLVGAFGGKWFSILDQRAISQGNNGKNQPANITLYRADGSALSFDYQPDGWWHSAGQTAKTSYITVSGDFIYFYSPGGGMEIYSKYGSLIQIKSALGAKWTFNYGNPSKQLSFSAPNDTLTSISHSGGRVINITWTPNTEAGTRVTKIVDPANNSFGYSYKSNALDTVTYPATWRGFDATLSIDTLKYEYDGSRRLLGKSYNGKRYSTFDYNSSGQAISSEHAGGVEKYSFDYSSPGQTKVTNPLGQSTVYYFDSKGRTIKTSGAKVSIALQPMHPMNTMTAPPRKYQQRRTDTRPRHSTTQMGTSFRRRAATTARRPMWFPMNGMHLFGQSN